MTNSRNVLVIDDERDRLDPLVNALEAEFGDEANVSSWLPSPGHDPLERFDELVADGVALIATDDDLTKSQLGLLGSSVTNWGQDRFIPVCNFSRQPQRRLPRERNFFELRVPPEPNEAARAAFIARIFRGFRQIRDHIAAAGDGSSIAHLLAGAMGSTRYEDDVAPFVASVASASSSFVQGVTTQGGLTDESRLDLLTFISGHILFNAVLEFPGPILTRRTLAAYCAVAPSEEGRLAELFVGAAYDGPFAAEGQFFQRRLVDRKIDELAADLTSEPEEPDQYNREAVRLALGDVENHGCGRCDGTRGGYWCPFTRRAVCDRADCSVTSEAWIPRGASVCRVERDYFEELAPLLGE